MKPTKIVHHLGCREKPEDNMDKVTAFLIENYKACGIEGRIYYLTIKNYKEILEKEVGPPESHPLIFMDVSLFDWGPEISEIKLIKYLHEKGYSFVGADLPFSIANATKFAQKKLFYEKGVPTSKYLPIDKIDDNLEKAIIDTAMAYPLLIKLNISYAALGISKDSLVWNFQDLKKKALSLKDDKCVMDGIYVEEFIAGLEYSCLVYEHKGVVKGLTPIEREFYNFKSEYEKFFTHELVDSLDFDDFVRRKPVTDPKIKEKVIDVSIQAFKATYGNCFARVDIRQNAKTGEYLVLEINSTPCLEEDAAAALCLKADGKSLSFLFDLWFNSP